MVNTMDPREEPRLNAMRKSVGKKKYVKQLALMGELSRIRTHLSFANITIFANIWYLILLIQSIKIILRIFLLYNQRVLADFWGWKDGPICASRKRSCVC